MFDTLRGCILALAVTIVGGLVLHYLPPAKEEHLLYSAEPINFAGSNSQVCISSIVVTNAGNQVATDLQGEFTFPNSHIKDTAVTSASGAEHELKLLTESSNAYCFTLARLLPRDGLKFSFIVDPSGTEPTITIRSDATVAMKATDLNQRQNQGQGTLSKIVVPMLLALSILLILLLVAYAIAYRSSHPKTQ